MRQYREDDPQEEEYYQNVPRRDQERLEYDRTPAPAAKSRKTPKPSGHHKKRKPGRAPAAKSKKTPKQTNGSRLKWLQVLLVLAIIVIIFNSVEISIKQGKLNFLAAKPESAKFAPQSGTTAKRSPDRHVRERARDWAGDASYQGTYVGALLAGIANGSISMTDVENLSRSADSKRAEAAARVLELLK